ncbi:hypothetical protein LEP1GSC072_3897 [Leptospira noguchii str. Bonito]|nr:hypothetical protein LEP1GSC072_3453 [Leptospira noguchii str. Bonito]EMI72216.1 hypothetical protein LEP1GSC072_0062 [Leptospira noguchii str. Bonito]EMI72360.1 hypothetical protein LEP1GSC072_3897 [Leptospira noguchii str. Bonito]
MWELILLKNSFPFSYAKITLKHKFERVSTFHFYKKIRVYKTNLLYQDYIILELLKN